VGRRKGLTRARCASHRRALAARPSRPARRAAAHDDAPTLNPPTPPGTCSTWPSSTRATPPAAPPSRPRPPRRPPRPPRRRDAARRLARFLAYTARARPPRRAPARRRGAPRRRNKSIEPWAGRAGSGRGTGTERGRPWEADSLNCCKRSRSGGARARGGLWGSQGRGEFVGKEAAATGGQRRQRAALRGGLRAMSQGWTSRAGLCKQRSLWRRFQGLECAAALTQAKAGAGRVARQPGPGPRRASPLDPGRRQLLRRAHRAPLVGLDHAVRARPRGAQRDVPLPRRGRRHTRLAGRRDPACGRGVFRGGGRRWAKGEGWAGGARGCAAGAHWERGRGCGAHL
jgi:hypothetical protein